ncbi:MAG: DUF58 domain-containing protein [Ferruginibacter sp.]
MFKRKKNTDGEIPQAVSENAAVLTTAEIIKKVRELEIKSKRITTHLFTGEYHSAFKGKGMRFREVREYAEGDDIRFIDWNVSARFSHPFTKLFEEERELTMMLLIDTSTSNLFGTIAKSKKELITELAAVLTFSAISNNDKVGVIFFSNKIEKYIPPKKGRQHALYIVRELLTIEPRAKGTNLDAAIKYFNNTTGQKSIAFLLSDFLDTGYENDLKVIGKKHDVIGIKVYDKMDMQLPDAGLLQLEDAETGKVKWVDSSNELVRYNYQQFFFNQTDKCKTFFLKAGADLLHVRTDEDYVKILQKFFLKRK